MERQLGPSERMAAQKPGCQERQHDQDDDDNKRTPGASRPLEERAFRRRLDTWRCRGIAAAVADERLIGDFGLTMRALHVGARSQIDDTWTKGSPELARFLEPSLLA